MDIKVLVANGSAQVRKNIANSLQEIGVRSIVEVTTGDEAVNGLRSDNFDIVFAEFNTQTGGQGIVEAVRQIDGNLPIIITAPKSQKLTQVKKNTPGASNYVTTPFNTQQLQQAIADFVPALAG
jgi:CheY-like chemotaxis protein